MWKSLTTMFDLNKSHSNDEIKITIDGENLTLRIKENAFYHTGEFK